MFVTADQLLAHAIGDYVLQSDWMANEKTKKVWAAIAHAFTYTLCFIPFVIGYPLLRSAVALAFIFGTHYLIDHNRLARYVVYAKNFLSPRESFSGDALGPSTVFDRWWHPWAECVGTGYHKDRPAWMTVWLMIIADNVMHVICNAAALRWLS